MGKVPYATVNLSELLTTIRNGHRLEKPTNSACSDEMYVEVAMFVQFLQRVNFVCINIIIGTS